MITIEPNGTLDAATFNVNGRYTTLDAIQISQLYCDISDLVENGVEGSAMIDIGNTREVLEEKEWHLAFEAVKYIIVGNARPLLNKMRRKQMH